MRKKIIILITILFVLPFKPLSAETGLQISPAVNDLIAKPGEAYVGSFTIKNKNEYNISLEPQKGLLDNQSNIQLENFSNASTEWIKLDGPETILNSQKEVTYNYSVNIPQDSQEGFYRPMFIFKLLAEQTESGTTTSLTELLPFQFNIFVSESGVYNGNIEIRKLGISSSVLVGTQQNIDFSIMNTSSSPSKPLIRIQVVSPSSDIIYQTVQNENLSAVYKDQSLANTLNISSAFKPDSKIGRYTVELISVDTLTSKTTSRKVAFWYIPQEVIYLILIILFLLIIFAFIVKKIRRNAKVNKKQDKHLFMYK